VLAGKVAIVTGGSRGMGRAIAERLARDGASVVVNYYEAEAKAAEVVARIQEHGGTALAVQADVTKPADAIRLFDAATEAFDRPAILVATAGRLEHGPFGKASEENYDRMFAFAKGTFFLLNQAATRIADGGRIITFSSSTTLGGGANAPAYAGAKAAIEQFTRVLAKTVGGRGITANVVLPGVTETDLIPKDPDFRSKAAARTSLGRVGQPEDIADIVAFLASEESRWITGQRIGAHGGSY